MRLPAAARRADQRGLGRVRARGGLQVEDAASLFRLRFGNPHIHPADGIRPQPVGVDHVRTGQNGVELESLQLRFDEVGFVRSAIGSDGNHLVSHYRLWKEYNTGDGGRQ
jgi:hypothetical protein